jgi:aspartate carbamoyltransferase catalytic subunit
MLRIQLERQDIQYFPSLREYTYQFQLNREILNKIQKPITILHPGPVNRGIEITSEIADSEHSLILNQVENGVAIRMAIIYLLAGSINRS